ncbi:piggyBac transposable element-derived protein 3-like isoform X1 [Anastrepha ludens]|uniref:piggyBac transposable element-derived protein 3-like isoform X1 n=1 Tax=Anastrepha ludens TaxID=28586 RepID=UPI0023B0AE6A|nr:piggyBac transposable element-derived protein 3-like isoform X1 [Anastrepha ludens]
MMMKDVNENDPPLVEEMVEEQESQSRVPCGAIFSTLLDKRKLIWKKRNMELDEDKITFLGRSAFPIEISQLETPYQCFKYFLDDDFIQKIVDQTNLYIKQKDTNSKITYTALDIKKFFGILLFMSVQRFPNTRSYWSPAFGYGPVLSTMPVNKFERMKLSLHFQNNDDHKPVGHPNHDRLFKIRPVIEHLRAKFSTVPMEQRLSVDEQMCATKVAHFLKQYLPNKPHKWGFKLYVLCDLSGYAHTFELYSGQENTGRPEGEPDIGATGNVVIRLLRDVPRYQNHIIYFDNFYTSLPLVHYLAKQGILSVGTVQQNRIPNSKLPDKREFMKKSVPRGSHVERTSTFDGVGMSCVTWKDNKMVTLLSTYVGSTPVSSVTRYDKAKKEKVEIPCPKIVLEYNKHMGGVDLMDSFLGRFHIPLRSKKWYLRIFFHLLDLTVINSWIIYKKMQSFEI